MADPETAAGNRDRAGGERLTLLDHAGVVWRHRWLILGLVVVALAGALTATLRAWKVYEATATLLAPREGTGGGLLGGLAASGLIQQAPAMSVPSFTPNRDMLTGILRSRTAAQAVVERFGLQQRYRVAHPEEAVTAFREVTRVVVSRDGVISITVADTDPARAAAMANFLVEELDRRVAGFGTGEAGRQRQFLTEQLARAKRNLEVSEASLRRFQEQHRAINLQEQTRGAIEAAARLKGEILAAEVQLQVMRNFATDANPDLVGLRRRIEEMKRQLAQMQYGDGEVSRPAANDRADFALPFPKVPEIGIELARLTRDLRAQETLVTLLTQQLEQVRMAEARDLPTVQVLDRAHPPLRHSRPRLGRTLALAGGGSLFAGVGLAFFLNHLDRLRGRGQPA